MTKSVFDAQLAVHEIIAEILVSLAIEDDTTDGDVQLLETNMGEVATMMIESLGLKITKVDAAGTKFTATLEIPESAPEEDQEAL